MPDTLNEMILGFAIILIILLFTILIMFARIRLHEKRLKKLEHKRNKSRLH